MENTSKALLIAGSVLIVLLLIGVGMLIYSRATGVVGTATTTMNSQEILAFNNQFTQYEGIQKGSTVRSLISKVIASNATYKDTRLVKVNGKDQASELSEESKVINTGKTYKVTLVYDNNGIVNEIQYNET